MLRRILRHPTTSGRPYGLCQGGFQKGQRAEEACTALWLLWGGIEGVCIDLVARHAEVYSNGGGGVDHRRGPREIHRESLQRVEVSGNRIVDEPGGVVRCLGRH